MKKINYKKYKITSKKYMGTDSYSWAIYINGEPVIVGLLKSQIPYYKKRAYKMYVVGEGKDEK